MCRSAWTRHLQNHPTGGEEYSRGSVVELTTIISLDNFDGVTKLCGDISGKSVRFDPQGKSLHKKGAIIKNN
jgi:hypothetical protein